MTLAKFSDGQALTPERLNAIVAAAVQNIVGGGGIQVGRSGTGIQIGLARRHRGVPPYSVTGSSVAAATVAPLDLTTTAAVGTEVEYAREDHQHATPWAVGDIKMAGRTADHTVAGHEWLLCDGDAISRTTYSALFAVVGTTFGAGNGSTTFNIPKFTTDGASPGDPSARVPAGAGGVLALGETGGTRTHDQVASAASNTTGITAAGTITQNTQDVQGAPPGGTQASHQNDGVSVAITDPAHGHSISMTQSAPVHLPPYLAVGFFVLAKIA